MIELIDFNQSLIEYFSQQGIALIPEGLFAVHEDTIVEPPMSLHGINIWAHPAKIGAFTYFGSGTFFNAEIGRYCSVGEGLRVGSSRHPTDFLTSSPLSYASMINFESYFKLSKSDWTRKLPMIEYDFRPKTVIGNDVWIGAGVYIKDGVTIADGAIIGAQAVVTRDVGPYCIVGGNPARLIRKRFSDRIIDRLMDLRWWRYNILEISDCDVRYIERALDRLEEALQSKTISEYRPDPINIRSAYAKFRDGS